MVPIFTCSIIVIVIAISCFRATIVIVVVHAQLLDHVTTFLGVALVYTVICTTIVIVVVIVVVVSVIVIVLMRVVILI